MLLQGALRLFDILGVAQLRVVDAQLDQPVVLVDEVGCTGGIPAGGVEVLLAGLPTEGLFHNPRELALPHNDVLGQHRQQRRKHHPKISLLILRKSPQHLIQWTVTVLREQFVGEVGAWLPITTILRRRS